MKLQFLLPAATFTVGAFAHADCKFFTDPTTHKGTLDLTAFCPKDAKKGDQVGEYRMDMNMCLTATKQGLALGNTGMAFDTCDPKGCKVSKDQKWLECANCGKANLDDVFEFKDGALTCYDHVARKEGSHTAEASQPHETS